jgi:hypothetical protein
VIKASSAGTCASSSSAIVPLPGHHPRIGIRMHQHGAGLALHLFGHRLARGLGRRTAVQHRAGVRDQVELGLHCALGHHHVGGDAARGRGQRQRTAVVAGRMGDHAAARVGIVQRPHRVAGATELERTTALRVLALEVQSGTANASSASLRSTRVTTACEAMRAAASRMVSMVGSAC